MLMMMSMAGFTQTVTLHLEESAGNCLLSSDCESQTICYDLRIEIDEPGWELRSYNVWFEFPQPPLMMYNSDNACLTQNGGDTDNSTQGQYRVGGVNGTAVIEAGVMTTFHTFCLEYDNGFMIVDSIISAGGPALVYGFEFESTLTLQNTTTGESVGLAVTSFDALPIKLHDLMQVESDKGWSGVSAWMQPLNSDIENVMAPVVDDLIIMYNLTDGIYSPPNNINTINTWNYKSGYIIKVSDGIELNICGSDNGNHTINLMAGWNIIPVLNPGMVPVEDVLGPLGSNLIIAKEIAGYRVYYPAYNINTLMNLQTGKAYLVKVAQACAINFPETDVSQTQADVKYYFEMNSPWPPIHKTPDSHIFCFANDALSLFEMGDLIGAFDQQGRCSGMMEVLDTQNSFSVPVFANDATTAQKDGLDVDEPIAFKLYRPSTGDEYNMELTYAPYSPAQGQFVSNGISIPNTVTLTFAGTGIQNYASGVQVEAYPNPTQGEVNLKIAGDFLINGKLILTNADGQLLYEQELLHQQGVSTRLLDFSKYTAGIYYLRLTSSQYYNIQKIVIH
jgi:hypothetical protein